MLSWRTAPRTLTGPWWIGLLGDSAYGERWATKWLDLARYADSAGYATDSFRRIWGYRDWVIRAINDNLPYDQFTIEQIAGDLLPECDPGPVGRYRFPPQYAH